MLRKSQKDIVLHKVRLKTNENIFKYKTNYL